VSCIILNDKLKTITTVCAHATVFVMNWPLKRLATLHLYRHCAEITKNIAYRSPTVNLSKCMEDATRTGYY